MNMKRKSLIIIIISIIIIFSFLSFIFIKNSKIVTKEIEIQSNQSNEIFYKNLNPVNLNEIIEENTKVNKSEKLVIEEIDLEYVTLYKENPNLPTGYLRTLQLGRSGKQNVILKQEYEDEELINEEIVANNVTKNSVEKIIEIGTGSGYVKTKVKEGDELYVSANNLYIKTEKDMESQDICLAKSGDSVEILGIDDTWYKIKYDENVGYVLKEGVSTYNPNRKNQYATSDLSVFSKGELMSKLDFDMDVSVQSDLSLEQFEAIFADQPSDTNNVFKSNAKYFYYAEEQYGINGVFLAAIAIHESAWGTSTISNNKRNLFGYAAYDNDPYNSASTFDSYAGGIDLVARVLIKNYLNPEGTIVFDGSSASGRFFSGKTISSVNKHYATDKNWANCVYKWMCKLYNDIPE